MTATVRSCVAEDGRALPAADTVVVLTGFRPDLSFLSELRLDLDPALQAPRRIAAEIDPNVHSCGSVRATGARDLAHPDEPDLYLVGMKSYGRAPTFLAMTGYEQVRSVAAMLAGDTWLLPSGSSWCCPTPASVAVRACTTTRPVSPQAAVARPRPGRSSWGSAYGRADRRRPEKSGLLFVVAAL